MGKQASQVCESFTDVDLFKLYIVKSKDGYRDNPFRLSMLSKLSKVEIEDIIKAGKISFNFLPSEMKTKEYYDMVVTYNGAEWDSERRDFNSQELFQKALQDCPSIWWSRFLNSLEEQKYLNWDNLKIVIENQKKCGGEEPVLMNFPEKQVPLHHSNKN